MKEIKEYLSRLRKKNLDKIWKAFKLIEIWLFIESIVKIIL